MFVPNITPKDKGMFLSRLTFKEMAMKQMTRRTFWISKHRNGNSF